MKFHPVTSFTASLRSTPLSPALWTGNWFRLEIHWVERKRTKNYCISSASIGKQYLERQKIIVEFMHLSLSGAEQQRSGSYTDINQKSLKSSKQSCRGWWIQTKLGGDHFRVWCAVTALKTLQVEGFTITKYMDNSRSGISQVSQTGNFPWANMFVSTEV